MKLNSLRFKAILFYSISLVIMLALYWLSQSGAARVTEDDVINNILRYEAEAYFNRYAQDQEACLPSMRYLTAVNDPAQIPDVFRETLSALQDGSYETCGPGAIPGPDSHNILLQTYPEGNRRLYLIFDSSFVITEGNSSILFKSIQFMFFLLTSLLGVLLVVVVGKVVFRPLDSLSAKLQSYGPDDLERTFDESKRKDEIGLLASSIQNSFKRVRLFIKREKEFSRDASHELRTPLSVIKGALELIRLSPESAQSEMNKPLSRIERSVADMEETIETLLWIAREKNRQVAGTPFSIEMAVEKVVQSLSPLAESKKITLQLELEDGDSNNAPERAFSIVLTNLLNNAFNFTANGTVGVSLKDSVVTVWDTGVGISEEMMESLSIPYTKGDNSSGFGLGLSIVQRLCDRFGWLLSISRRTGGGTLVSIDFSSTRVVHR
ncbi:sensor histidine kinase [Maridesulfovibrio sp.]